MQVLRSLISYHMDIDVPLRDQGRVGTLSPSLSLSLSFSLFLYLSIYLSLSLFVSLFLSLPLPLPLFFNGVCVFVFGAVPAPSPPS